MAMVSMTQVRPLDDATHLLSDPEGLRARAEEEGALFFRGLLDSDSVLSVRRQILEVCASHGWVNPGSNPMQGIANSDVVVGLGAAPQESVAETGKYPERTTDSERVCV